MNLKYILPSSFRDPSGFLFKKDNIIYRQINSSAIDDYNKLMNSGLYEKLLEKNLIIPHEDVTEQFDVKENIEYDISHLPNGIYFALLTNGRKKSVIKFTKLGHKNISEHDATRITGSITALKKALNPDKILIQLSKENYKNLSKTMDVLNDTSIAFYMSRLPAIRFKNQQSFKDSITSRIYFDGYNVFNLYAGLNANPDTTNALWFALGEKELL